MKPDEVITLAQEAHGAILASGKGMYLWHGGAVVGDVQDFCARFAALIEVKLMERLLTGAGEPHYWTQRLEDDTVNMVPFYYPDQLAAAVLREREECAAICDEAAMEESDDHAMRAIESCGRLIRDSGNT